MDSDLQQIQHLVSSGRASEALTVASRFTRDQPGDPQGWFLLAGVHSMLGRFDDVITCCRKVMDLDPSRFDALYNLGVALQHRGKFEEAADSYRRAVELKPDFAPAYANLGMVLWKLESYDEAEAACREAIRLDVNQFYAVNNLGLVLRTKSQLNEAIAVYEDLVQRAPQMPEARLNYALCLRALDRRNEAQTQLAEAIRLKSDYHEAHVEQGKLALTEQRFSDAIASFERACQLDTEDAEVWINLGKANLSEKKFPEAERAFNCALEADSGRAEAHVLLGSAILQGKGGVLESNSRAEKHFSKAIRLEPDSVEAHLNLAACLRSQGKLTQALESYRRVLALAPRHPVATGGAASMLEHLGNFEEARELLSPMLEKKIETLSIALPYAAISRYTGEKEKAIELLERLLADEASDRPLRMEGHFMLGKLHDGEKNYDAAFRHYRVANELDPEKFDIEGNGRSFDTLMSHFEKKTHHGRPRASNRTRLPIFIVGMPRSGTTLTEQILASHPLVHGAGELIQISEIKQSLPRQINVRWPLCMDHLDRKMLDKIAKGHLDWLGTLARGKARVTDKMPHNFLSLGLIDLLFPEARIIHCRRDPADNCLSIFFQHFNGDHCYANNLEHLGLYYRQYEKVMAHWREVVHVPILEVHYEQTVAEPEQSARRLVEFCGLDWDDRCLRFYESGRVVSTPSYDQVRQPIYKKSVARWKRYEKYLEPLLRSLDYAEPSKQSAGS